MRSGRSCMQPCSRNSPAAGQPLILPRHVITCLMHIIITMHIIYRAFAAVQGHYAAVEPILQLHLPDPRCSWINWSRLIKIG
jgi:hypothetical protein